jgi:hypothetical protein
MGIRSYIRDRKQVKVSRAGNGAAAASEFVPPKPPRPGAGAPRPAGSKPKRESGNPPSSTPPLSPTEKNMHKKPDYKENAYLTMKEKSALPIDWDKHRG